MKTFLKKIFVMRHKRRLAGFAPEFQAYPDVAFVFQTFNKDSNVPFILDPFLRRKVKNVILFADGCVDRTATISHRMLAGKQHYVVQSNDTHEINNYRLAMLMARSFGCRYAMLLQDDDLYDGSIFGWLDKAIGFMREDEALAIVGGNGGANFVPERCTRANDGLTTAKFEMWKQSDRRGFRLGNYQEMILSGARPKRGEYQVEFVATVNRAPQIMRVAMAIAYGFFPEQLEPYQYDDDFNCLKAWSNGSKVLHMPVYGKQSNVGLGGMRLYNNVNINERPKHFCRNWNTILDHFGDFINSKRLDGIVRSANRSAGICLRSD